MMDIPPEFLTDPEKRRKYIEENIPGGPDHQDAVDELNAMFEWLLLLFENIDEMPEHREKYHLRKITRVAKELARDVGVVVDDHEHMGKLILAFLGRTDDDDDPEMEPEPEPEPSESVPA